MQRKDVDAMTNPTDDDSSGVRRALLALKLARRSAAAASRPGALVERSEWPASFAQERLWFLHQLDPDDPSYNNWRAVRLTGPLDVAALRRSLVEMVRRHQVLRSTFEQLDGQLRQKVHTAADLPLELVDLTGTPEDGRLQRAREHVSALAGRGFQLTRAPLLRAALVKLADHEHVLALVVHHIVADGWSVGIFWQEFARLYAAFRGGLASPLREVPLQYGEYAARQRLELQGGALQRLTEYWTRQLRDLPSLELPTDRARDAAARGSGARHSFTIPIDVVERLAALSERENATLAMTLLGAFAVLLGRYAGAIDLAIGMPIANRNRLESESLIGFLVNLLVVRTRLEGNPSLREMVRRVRQTAAEAYAHQDLPFERLVRELHVARDASRHPLVQVLYVFHNTPPPDAPLDGLTVEDFPIDAAAVPADLQLSLRPTAQGLQGGLKYRADLFESATIARIAAHYRELLTQFSTHPDRRLSEVRLPRESTDGVMPAARGTASDPIWPDRQTLDIVDRFRAVVERHPSRIAVKTPDWEWTYAQLDIASDSAAAHLQGLPAGANVALLFPHEGTAAAAMLGALKAGHPYVPLDPAYPRERLSYMLEDSGAFAIVASAPTAALANQLSGGGRLQVIDIDSPPRAGQHRRAKSPPADALAYILYTSGSTGTPTGVMQTRRNLLHFMRTYAGNLGVGPADRLTLFSSYSFDAAVMDVFGALLSGATLLPVDVRSRSAAEIWRWIADQRVTVYHSTPTLYRHLLGQPPPGIPGSIRLVVLGGEEVHAGDLELFDRHFGAQATLVNGFGPTESTLALQHFVPAGSRPGVSRVPIGVPVEGVDVVLLNSRGEDAVLQGEIALRSRYFATGYWNRPTATALAFVPDTDGVGARLYRTGDHGRLLPNGAIEFLGRRDRQIKVAGHRIELGEIEATIRRHVKEVAVTAVEGRPGHDDRRIAAYVVLAEGTTLADVKEAVRGRLPQHMHPQSWMVLDSLPLTPTGKLDRRGLPPPSWDAREGGRERVLPRTSTEEALTAIWADVLGVEGIGIDDDFFALGGHSLLATTLLSRIKSELSADLSLRALFDAPTVAAVAARIAEQHGKATEHQEAIALSHLVPDPASRHAPFPLTDVQQAYWLGRHEVFEGGNISTHSYTEIELEQPDVARITAAWNRLVARHDMMRAIVLPDGTQQVLEHVAPYEIQVIDLGHLDAAEAAGRLAAVRAEMSHQVMRPEVWPLFDVRLSLLGDGRGRLHASIDRLLFDAASARIILRELARLYVDPQADLPPLGLTFRDYVMAAERIETTELFKRSEQYWMSRLAELPPSPDLPLVKSPAGVSSPRFVRRSGTLDRDAWTHVKATAGRAGITASGVLLAAFSEVVAAWCRHGRFTLNLTLFNRRQLHPDVNHIVGDFTSTALLAVDCAGGGTFLERSRRLQRQLWQDLDHSHFSGVRVLRELARRQGGATRALMPVVFTSTLNLPGDADQATGRAFGRLDYGISQTSQVWLDHQVAERDGALTFTWDAVDELFPADLLSEMFEAYEGLLRRLAIDAGSWERDDLALLPDRQARERARVNATAAPLVEQTLDGLFRQRAASQPDRLAVISGDRRLTYGDLRARATALAARLRRSGATASHPVAVVMDKGWRQVVAVLAILEAGGVYLPIDADSPPQRLRQLLELGDVELVVTEPEVDGRLAWPNHVRRVCVEDRADPDGPMPVVEGGSRPDDLAYVIWTSGSTGTPKGVMITHLGAVNTILDVNDTLAIGPDDRVLAVSSLTFDLSVWDIFGTLAAGATLVVPSTRDPWEWATLLVAQRVTVWNSAPPLMEMLLEQVAERPELWPRELRLVMLSGDWISITLPERLRRVAPGARLISLGGATEASIWSIWFPVEQIDPAWKSIPYGFPMRNQSFHVLNDRMRPCPDWVAGELFIGGAGLARGYWRDPERTGHSFITHPSSGERLYRTGDLGRYRPGGMIEFLGREDHQVKVSGHRIELGEIESVIRRHPAVAQAVVTVADNGRGEKALVGYVVPKPGVALDPGDLRRIAQESLPRYMVPSAWVRLDSLPLSESGKTDRRRLPPPRWSADQDANPEPPATEVEEQIARLWRGLLGIERIGRHDDFFALGGDSVLATRFITRFRDAARVHLPLRTVFDAPTVAGLARFVAEAQAAPVEADVPEIERRPRRAPPAVADVPARADGPGEPCN